MARRHIYPRNGYELREPPPSSSRQPPPPSHHVSRHSVPLHHLEDRVAIQHREIQSLLLENQRLGATHVALKQELSRAQQELRHLSSTAADVKAERDAEVRQVYEKSLKLDAEARVIDAMKAEMNQVRGDIEHLGAVKQDLIKRLDEINGELAKERADSKEVTVIKAEIDNERQEIQRGRYLIYFVSFTFNFAYACYCGFTTFPLNHFFEFYSLQKIQLLSILNYSLKFVFIFKLQIIT